MPPSLKLTIPSTLKRQNAIAGLNAMANEGTPFELPLTSADPSRPPIFPVLFSTYHGGFDSIEVHLPDSSQINANGGLKRLIQDVTATYRDEWAKKGEKFVVTDGDDGQRMRLFGADIEFMSSLQKTRKEKEAKEGFEDDRLWREYAEKEIRLMVRQMVWWSVGSRN